MEIIMSKNSPSLAFIHIEKAAGSTLHEIFSTNILGYHIFSPYKFIKNRDNENEFLTCEELKSIKKYYPLLDSFGGHSIRSFSNYEDVFPSLLYITFLRDPIERFYSHFLHQTEIMNIDWTLDSFISSGNFNNFMCRKICGNQNSKEAISEINNKFFHVGLIENFDESLIELSKKLNDVGITFNTSYVKKNIRSQRTQSKPLIDKKSLDKIYAANLEDLILYKKIKQQHSSQNKLDITTLSNQLTLQQRLYSFLNKFNRHSYVKFLERKLRNQDSNTIA